VTFAKPGQYTIACNEYCGLMHHAMVGTVIVK
jgi:heme/copper-type cytochrome/quinol oxidase subunit 2